MDMFGDFIPDDVNAAAYLRIVCLVNVSFTAFCIVPIIYGTYTLRVFDSQKMAPEEATIRCATENSIFSDELLYRCYKAGYEKEDILTEDQLDVMLITPEVEMFLLTQGSKMYAVEVLQMAAQGQDADSNMTTKKDKSGGLAESITVQEFVMLCTYMRQT